MLTVTVKINGKPIAEAQARNTSNLGRISNYKCKSIELKGPFTEETATDFRIDGHMREQSCWALVELMATEICRKTPHRRAAEPPGGENG